MWMSGKEERKEKKKKRWPMEKLEKRPIVPTQFWSGKKKREEEEEERKEKKKGKKVRCIPSRSVKLNLKGLPSGVNTKKI